MLRRLQCRVHGAPYTESCHMRTSRATKCARRLCKMPVCQLDAIPFGGRIPDRQVMHVDEARQQAAIQQRQRPAMIAVAPQEAQPNRCRRADSPAGYRDRARASAHRCGAGPHAVALACAPAHDERVPASDEYADGQPHEDAAGPSRSSEPVRTTSRTIRLTIFRWLRCESDQSQGSNRFSWPGSDRLSARLSAAATSCSVGGLPDSVTGARLSMIIAGRAMGRSARSRRT